MLESAYEALLFAKLSSLDVKVDRQVPINIEYDGVRRLVNNHKDFASSRLRANQFGNQQ